MSGTFAATVDLRLKPSLRALRAVFVLHVICLVLLPLAMQPGWPMIVLVAAFGASWFALRHSAVLGFNSKAVTRVIWHADGNWSVFRGAREYKAELRDNSIVHPALTVLNFKLLDGGRATRLIAGDEADAELLRRLRARLALKV
jgi:toxin CptA